MRHVYNSLYMVILTNKADITSHVTKQNEKKWTGKNTTLTGYSNDYQFKLWQIYNWLWNVLLKKFITPEEIDMSFALSYIKCQTKQSSTPWNLLLFIPLCLLLFHFQYFTHSWILLTGFHDCQYLYSGTPLIWPPSSHGNLVVLTGWSY